MNFKIAMLALVSLAFTQTDANAQTSKNAKNYPICKHNGEYKVCSHKEAMNNTEELSAGRKVENQVIKSNEPVKAVVTNKALGESGVATAYEVPAEAYPEKQKECKEEIFITGAEAGYSKDSPYYKTTIVCVTSNGYKDNPRLVVSYDQPGDLYNGEDVMANDGPEKNRSRNINYLDWRGKVPNDGGLATKR